MALHPTSSFSKFSGSQPLWFDHVTILNIVLSITFCFLADLFGSQGSVQENEKHLAVWLSCINLERFYFPMYTKISSNFEAFMKRYWILIASPCPKLTSFTATLCRTNSNSMCNVSIIRSSKSESWCSASPSSVLGLLTLEGWRKEGNKHKGNMPVLKIQIFRFVLLSYSSKSASQPVCQLVRQWVLLRLYWGVPQFMFSIKSPVFCTLTQWTKPWGHVDQKNRYSSPISAS